MVTVTLIYASRTCVTVSYLVVVGLLRLKSEGGGYGVGSADYDYDRGHGVDNADPDPNNNPKDKRDDADGTVQDPGPEIMILPLKTVYGDITLVFVQ